MIIPRHKICDICEETVGVNNRYFILKSKNYIVASGGSCLDNKTHHICADCMYKITDAILKELKEKNKND